MSMITLYHHPLSGHVHRVEVFLSILGLDYKIKPVDLMKGEQKSDAFLAKNPFGQIPVIEDGNFVQSDANAILVYLAKKYDGKGQWLPTSDEASSEVQKYLSLAAGPLANGPASARLINLFGAPLDKARTHEISKKLFTLLNQTLTNQDWLVGQTPTLADVAHYSYIARANEGDINLSPYPHIVSWLKRFEQIPGFIEFIKTT